ncbi:winged helix-turn-helix transcriptional regulator [Streptomonospora arabica]|uniref:Winged helix-turn-helix transcriptional regulator n=1 Tax=Streptomonospora arabica TaxID=412417 RepID=A0ABV9ST80_9ACTN
MMAPSHAATGLPAVVLTAAAFDRTPLEEDPAMVMAVLDRPRRFNGIKRRLEGVTQRGLTQALRRLEYNGMLELLPELLRDVANMENYLVGYGFRWAGASPSM